MRFMYRILLLALVILCTLTVVCAEDNVTVTSVSDDNIDVLSDYAENDNCISDDIKVDNTITKNSDNSVKTSSSTITVTDKNYNLFYERNDNSYIPRTTSLIESGDTVKLKGTFTNVNFTVDKRLNFTSYDDNTQLINCTVFIIGDDASGSSISNLRITNNGTLLRGIQVKNSSNLLIENNIVKTYGLRSYGFVADYMNNSTIRLNTFERAGDDWRYITFVIGNSNYNTIDKNNILSGGANGIYLSIYGSSEANFDAGPSNHNNITNNNVSARGNITSWCYTIQVMGAYNNIINNTVDGGFRGISTQDYENNVIRGNDVNAISEGIYACESALVSDNYIHVTGSASGITVGGDNVRIVNNTINSVDGQAIEIRANNVYIANNTILSTGSYAIHSKGKYSGIVIDNNKITSNDTGILFRRQSFTKRINNILVTRNNIISQGDYAVNFLEAGSSNTVDVNVTVDSSNVLTSTKGRGSVAYLPPENVDNETLFDSRQVIIISEDNYDEYFSESVANSEILQNATVYLNGTFNDKNFTFNRKVHLIGLNCTINDGTITLTGDAHSSSIKDLKINNPRKDTTVHAVEVFEVNNCIISNVSIYNSAESESLGIFIYAANGNNISKCNITTSSDYINDAILLYSSDSNILEDNIVHIMQSGVRLAYDDSIMFNEKIGTITEVLHNHGIILLYSSDNLINRNTVKVTSDFKNYTYPSSDCKNSIVGIDLYFDCHNNRVTYNNISFKSFCPYIYGFGVLGGNWGSSITSLNATANQFRYNNVNITGGYFATGFIAGRNSISTVVESNNISVYTIHNTSSRGDYSHAVTLENSTKSNITGNHINIEGASVYPVELFDSTYNNIKDNIINANATHPYGISGYRTSGNNITRNTFTLRKVDYGSSSTAQHSDVIESGDDGIMLTSTSSYNNITLNTIDTNATYTVRLDSQATYNNVTNNSLKAKSLAGDQSIQYSHNSNIVRDNFLYFVDLSVNNITAKIGDTVNFTAKVKSNTNKLSNLTVTFKLGTSTLGTSKVINNTATLSYHISNLWNPTVYTLIVSAGGKNFQNSTVHAQAIFTQDPVKTIVSVAKIRQTIGSVATLTANITTGTGGHIGSGQAEFYLDGTKLATVNLSLGVASYNYKISSNANASVHTIKVVYLGTNDYKKSSGINTLGIQSKSSISSKNYTATIDKIVNIKATVKSGKENIEKGNVHLYIGKTLIGNASIKDGLINYNYTIPTSIDKGSYNLSFIYDGNDTTSPAASTVNIKVNPITPVFSYNKTTVLVGSNVSLVLNVGNGLNDTHYYAADGGNISIKLNDRLLQDANGTTINGVVKNGTLIIKFTAVEQLMGYNNITFIYSGNGKFDSYTKRYTNGLNIVEKFNTQITVTTVKGVIGNTLTLKATVTDVNNKNVTNGYAIFKLNGITIKDNKKLTGSTDNLKAYVKNGVATATITADLDMRHAKNLTAVYAGSSTYNASRSNTATAEIALRNASITVKSNLKTAKQGQTITLTATIKDMLRDNNRIQSYDGQYVFFKVNGITLKDSNGKTLQAKITNGTATAKYTIPLALSGVTDCKTMTPKNHTITAGLYNPNYYPDARGYGIFQTERSNTTINIIKSVINTNTNKLSVNATINDYLGNLVSGPNKCIIKINGATLKNGNNPQYFQANNGKLTLDNITIPKQEKYTKIEIVTQDRLSYKSSRTTSTKITLTNS